MVQRVEKTNHHLVVTVTHVTKNRLEIVHVNQGKIKAQTVNQVRLNGVLLLYPHRLRRIKDRQFKQQLLPHRHLYVLKKVMNIHRLALYQVKNGLPHHLDDLILNEVNRKLAVELKNHIHEAHRQKPLQAANHITLKATIARTKANA